MQSSKFNKLPPDWQLFSLTLTFNPKMSLGGILIFLLTDGFGIFGLKAYSCVGVGSISRKVV